MKQRIAKLEMASPYGALPGTTGLPGGGIPIGSGGGGFGGNGECCAQHPGIGHVMMEALLIILPT
jgi:hypothetical protein